MSAGIGSIVHMCLDIRGALRWPNKRLRGMLRDPETGRYLDANKTRDWLMDRLAEGKCVLPFGKPCEGFSYETGCPGHDPDAGAAQ